MAQSQNAYLPLRATIQKITQETLSPQLDVKTYRLCPEQPLDFAPGQFIELSIPGMGECPIGFSSLPLEGGCFDITVKRTGKVTQALHMLREGDPVWVRGPFGNTFPLEKMQGADLLVLAGGLGLAPLRPFIQHVLAREHRAAYGEMHFLLAARTAEDHCFSYDYEHWQTAGNTKLTLAIDAPEEGWQGKVGYPHNLVKEMELDLTGRMALVCGPPVMIKAVQQSLEELGMPPARMYTTLEMRMSCGVGKCGKCNIGHRYVCVDGPVFSMDALEGMPGEY